MFRLSNLIKSVTSGKKERMLDGSIVIWNFTNRCNLTCRFCQNWDISKSRQMDTLADAASPEAIARAAHRLGCSSVAFTYNDPVIFMEYAIDTAQACHKLGIKTVAVTLGNMVFTIDPTGKRTFHKVTRIGTKPHRTPLPFNRFLPLHNMNDLIFSRFMSYIPC
jgi:uncharacterized Fe-S cluster-containing radical SAM superfamily protein